MRRRRGAAEAESATQEAGRRERLPGAGLPAALLGARVHRRRRARRPARVALQARLRYLLEGPEQDADVPRPGVCLEMRPRPHRQTLNTLYEDMRKKNIKPVKPSGFVFHESRVGSTLVANMLAAVPTNIVYSESAPPPAVLNHCRSCSKQRKTDILQKLIALMGASPTNYHTHLFFKFQSATVPNIRSLLDAFPETPWLFVYVIPCRR